MPNTNSHYHVYGVNSACYNYEHFEEVLVATFASIYEAEEYIAVNCNTGKFDELFVRTKNG